MPPWNICWHQSNAISTFPSESENGTEKLPVDVSQFYFRRAKWGFQGGEAPLASLGCARTGCIRCKMACRFAKLAYHPRHDYSGFWGGADVGKAASERALLFPHLSPRKNLQKPPRGMIVVLWFFVGDEWRKAMHCFRGLFSACPLPEKNHSAAKQATCSCGNCRKTDCTFIKNACMIPLSMFNTPPLCFTVC